MSDAEYSEELNEAANLVMMMMHCADCPTEDRSCLRCARDIGTLINVVRAEERAARASLEAAAQEMLNGARAFDGVGVMWCRECWERWDAPHDDDCGAGALARALAGTTTPAVEEQG